MKRTPLILLTVFCVFTSGLAAYKIKEFTPKAAKEYPAYQDFQKIVIGASPRVTQAGIDELFDTKRMLEKQIMPVVVVIENQNDFAIRVAEQDIFLIGKSGARMPTMSYDVVLLKLSLKKPLSGYATRKEILIKQVGNKDMVKDFEHKSFGEKLIAPHASDFGVVFFPLPENGDLTGARLYFPSVHNVTEEEPLMFFEFDLTKSKE